MSLKEKLHDDDLHCKVNTIELHSIIRILAVARACRKYLEFETNASGEFLGIEFMQRINWDALSLP